MKKRERNTIFFGCYATWQKDGIYAATKLSVEISVHNANIYSLERIFLQKGNSTIPFNYQNDELEKFRGLRKNESFIFQPNDFLSNKSDT